MPVFWRVICTIARAALTAVMIAGVFSVTWVAMIYSAATMPQEEAALAVIALLLSFLLFVIQLMDARHPRVTMARKWQWSE